MLFNYPFLSLVYFLFIFPIYNLFAEEERVELLIHVFQDMLCMVKSGEPFFLITHRVMDDDESPSDTTASTEDGESSPKKRRVSHEEFHGGLW